MCEFASIVLIKEQAFWALVDSHEEIIRKHGLHADGVGGPNVLRVEICPPSLDGVGLRAPLAEWTYRVDQDIMPEWADAERDEERARLALAELVAERVIVDRTHIKKITEGVYYLIHNATVDAMGNATVDARDNATVTAMGNATVDARDNATVDARDNATVDAMGNATVTAMGNATVDAMGNATVDARDKATVTAWDNATVTAWDNATVDAMGNATVTAMGNATVDARDKATVDAMGNATVTAWDNATVTARGNATVGAVNDHATVRAYNPQPDVEILGPYAVLIDCTGERAVCRVGE